MLEIQQGRISYGFIPDRRYIMSEEDRLIMIHLLKYILNFRNSLFMLYKNLPDDRLHSVLFIRKILDGMAASCFLLRAGSAILVQFSKHISVLQMHGKT